MKYKKTYLFFFLLLILTSASAATPAPAADINLLNVLAQAMSGAVAALTTKAMTWLGALATLQLFMTNYKLLTNDGELSAVVIKAGAFVVWVTVVVFIMNNGPAFISKVGNSFFSIQGIDLPSPGDILIKTAILTGVLAVPATIAGAINSSAGNFMFIIVLLIAAGGFLFAAKILMLQIELGFIVFLSPLSFAFLGLSHLREQGLAPFRSLISLGYRIIIIGMIASAFGGVSDLISNTISSINMTDSLMPVTGTGIGPVIKTLTMALMTYLTLIFVLFKSDSIASNLASGSSSMGTGDLAGAVAAGVAGGMAVAAAGQTAAAGVSSMGDFMKNMMSNGAVSNAGGTGSGNPSSQPIPDASALSSLSSSGTQPSMSLDDVRAAEQVGAGGGSPAGVDAGVDAGGGSSGGAATALFSKADGAAAASAVPATASQNTRNAAAVGAAMRASGAPESMAALAENIVADGGGAQGVANACGTTPAQNAAVDNALAGAAEIGGGSSAPASSSGAGDPGWLDSGSAVSPGGSGANAGIGNGGAETAQKPTMSDHLSNLGKRMGEAGKHLENTSAATHVSISTHSQD
jgi:type IV secretion system protein TrbL